MAAGLSSQSRLASGTIGVMREHVLIDTSLSHPALIRAAVDLLGADNVVAGSDFPIVGGPLRGPLTDAMRQAGLSEEVVGRLGGGGMGRVYLGESPAGRRVAIKVIRADLAEDPVFRLRFQREVTLTARLQHPNILPVLRAGKAGELLFYIAPFIEGESLRQRIDQFGLNMLQSVPFTAD